MNRRKFLKKSLEGIVVVCCICSIPLISGCKKNPVESEPDSILNSNSIIKDGIKYYMQTNKKIYSLGEEVEMLYRVTNLGKEEVTFNIYVHLYQPSYVFRVMDGDVMIWTNQPGAVVGVTFYDSFTLQLNENKEFYENWNTNVNGAYDVIGHLLFPYENDKYAPVSVPVEIIQ